MEEALAVKGSSIRSKLVYVETNAGRKTAQQLETYLASKGTHHVLDASWYPYETYVDCLAWIAENCFDSDLTQLENVGKFSAHQALTTTYDIFVSRSDFPGFLKKISTLHGRFYNRGCLQVEFRSEVSCRLTITETPGFSEADTYIARGFYVGAAELLGLDSIVCEQSRTPDGAVFLLSW